MRIVLAPPAPDDWIRLLRAWRFWFIGGLLGGLLGMAWSYAAPPPYRARATVIVDFHLEQAWPQNTDREQFYYLEREARKLEEIAVSDATLANVTRQVPGSTAAQLRDGQLQLSQPGNGGWHFFATDADPQRARALASAWATAFIEEARAQIAAGPAGGLEPYITLQAVQAADIPASRSPAPATYVSAGAVSVLGLSAFAVLFLGVRQRKA